MQYRLRTLLILMAVVALWLSTITGYKNAHDVRSVVILSILVASGVAAIKYDGPPRAFWVGFFLTILTKGLDDRSRFAFAWTQSLLNGYGIRQNLPNGSLDPRYFFLMSTEYAVVLLLLAAAMGFLGILVFGAIAKSK